MPGSTSLPGGRARAPCWIPPFFCRLPAGEFNPSMKWPAISFPGRRTEASRSTAQDCHSYLIKKYKLTLTLTNLVNNGIILLYVKETFFIKSEDHSEYSNFTFGGGNTIRTAPLRTEPYRTLKWKRGSSGYVAVMQLVCSILLRSGYVGAAYVLKIRDNIYSILYPTHCQNI